MHHSSKEISFEYILRVDNNWTLFQSLYSNWLRDRDDIISEVKKMLTCGNPKGGFATYYCLECHETKIIPFSCKSKLCSRCGKKYTDIWSEEVNDLLLNTNHRHIVLTVSDKLWPYFIDNAPLQKLLMDTATKIIKNIFSIKEKLIIGIISVLHPYGDDLKPNFHVHMLVTTGGLSKDLSQWVTVSYIEYTIIRKTWQYEILTALRRYFTQHQINDAILPKIIDWCFTYKKNGFVIFAKRTLQGSKRSALKYLARYVRHPAISKRRIVAYDGTYVTFTYEAHGKAHVKKMPKFEFIKAVLQHTASPQFKTIRRYGLYARRATQKYTIATRLLTPIEAPSYHHHRFDWRENAITYTGKDPLSCDKCGSEMALFQITYPTTVGLKTIGGFDWLYEKPAEDIPINLEKEISRQIYLSEV